MKNKGDDFMLNEKMLEMYLEENSLSKGEQAVFEKLDIYDIETAYNYGCVVGVSGFIYYNETESFFDEYSDEILEKLEERKNECGVDFLNNLEFTKNNFTWFFVESVVYDFVTWAECEYVEPDEDEEAEEDSEN